MVQFAYTFESAILRCRSAVNGAGPVSRRLVFVSRQSAGETWDWMTTSTPAHPTHVPVPPNTPPLWLWLTGPRSMFLCALCHLVALPLLPCPPWLLNPTIAVCVFNDHKSRELYQPVNTDGIYRRTIGKERALFSLPWINRRSWSILPRDAMLARYATMLSSFLRLSVTR